MTRDDERERLSEAYARLCAARERLDLAQQQHDDALDELNLEIARITDGPGEEDRQ